MTKKPLLSVVMITYGHALYIKKAIEGVLSQKTGFCFEFIIANDCSPDNSDEIIRKTIASAPDHILVKYIHHKRNIGAIKNLKNAFDETTTEYIAFCEGDDYWTDPEKLQIQYDIISVNEKCGLLYTDVDFYDFATGKLTQSVYEKTGKTRTRSFEEHLEKKGYLAPPTWMFRKKLLEYCGFENETDFTFILALEAFKNSEIHYLNKVTAVRNFVPNSATSEENPEKTLQYKKGVFEIQKRFITKYSVSRELEERIYFDNYIEMSTLAVKTGDKKLLQEANGFFEQKNVPFERILEMANRIIQLEKLANNKVNAVYQKLRKYI